MLGQDTAAVLADVLHLSGGDLDALKQDGIIA
jgi:hypothetical protein